MSGRKFKKMRRKWFLKNVGWFSIRHNSSFIDCDRHIDTCKCSYINGSSERIIESILQQPTRNDMFWYAWKKQFVFDQLSIVYGEFDERFND